MSDSIRRIFSGVMFGFTLVMVGAIGFSTKAHADHGRNTAFVVGAVVGAALAAPQPAYAVPPTYYGGGYPVYYVPSQPQVVYQTTCWVVRQDVYDVYGRPVGFRPVRVCR